ncbi:MAG: DUF2723 domain-containing protein [Phycisphaerae bacterium]|nr:DUF2723 domain-containing protein [Phycisphaerae bacterium]
MVPCEITKRSQRSRRRIALEYAGVCAAALVLYAVSCAPGALWQDSGMIQYRTWHNDIEGHLGLALAHPLYYIVAIGAKSVNVGSFFYRINLISAAAAAVAVANLFLLLRLWLGKVWPAAVAAISLALSHTFWQHASISETYTMYTAMLLAELVLMLQFVRTKKVGWLYGLALTNGLAIAVHMFASIPLVCYAVFVIVLWASREIRLRQIVICVMLWMIGAAAYEYLIVKHMIATGDIAGTLASAAFGGGYKSNVLNMAMSWGIAKENLLYILLNFPTPNIIFGFVGILGLWRLAPRPGFAAVVLSLLVLFLLFAFRYTVVDRYSFFIPFYAMFSLMLGLGAHLVMEKKQCRKLAVLVLLLALLPVPAYAVAPQAARKFHPQLGMRRQIPFRDDYSYFLRPWKTTEHGPDRFAHEALGSVETHAVIWADTTTAFPLLMTQQVRQVRKDVTVMTTIAAGVDALAWDEAGAGELVSKGLLYVVSPLKGYCPPEILSAYDFVQAGVLWRVVVKDDGPQSGEV